MSKEQQPQSEDEPRITRHRVHCFLNLGVASNPRKNKICFLPKSDQNPWFLPLSKTTRIPDLFSWQSLPDAVCSRVSEVYN